MSKPTPFQWTMLFSMLAVVFAVLIFDIQPFTVTNGSMRPAIGKNALVVVAKSDDLAVGDVITFNTSQMGVVTHRIHEVNPDGTYVTKGDFNNAPDLWVVERQAIIGEKLVVIPRIGAWFQSSFWKWKVKQLQFWGGILFMLGALVFYWLFLRSRDEEVSEGNQRGRHRLVASHDDDESSAPPAD